MQPIKASLLQRKKSGQRLRVGVSILQIKWSRPALADLIEAQAYIVQENPQAAEVIAQRIWDATQTLADNPLIGRNGHLAGTRLYN